MKRAAIALYSLGALAALGVLAWVAKRTRTPEPEPAPRNFATVAAAVQAVNAEKLASIRALKTPQERLGALLAAFPDAHPMFADKYSSRIDNSSGTARDEFGRGYKGGPWNPVGFAVQVYEQVAPVLPIPPPAKAAIAAAIAVGRGKSLKDAALDAARSALPPTAQIGFDVALGIANGESVDKAALDALWANYPEAKYGYDVAVKVKQ
jgi:hypothetical protein